MDCLKNNSLIDENVFFLLDTLEKRGHEARVVGGALRDFLLKEKISDIDIATSAIPTEVIDIFAERGLKTIPTGLRYGSVTVVYKNKPYEITTLREDVKTFGRRAEVKFSKSFEADSNRRDFTINALYMDKNGKIYDYHSGIEDIFSKRIRFIGDARQRIREDYLRILRYFRFVASRGDYKCNAKYLEAIAELKDGVKMLSIGRVVQELLKIFELPDSHKIIPPMREVLDELFLLKANSIDACAKLGIFDSLSCVERLSMALKFSGIDPTQKYDFPRTIKEALRLKAVDRPRAFAQLKQTRKPIRIFYAKFLTIDAYINCNYSETDAKNFLQELLDFCQSEYADFKLSSDDLKEYNLTQEELKAVMIAAKKFWMNGNPTLGECKKFAAEYVKRKA